MNNYTVERLSHGGVMVNYQCNAACAHCLYASSPTRSVGYITREMTEEIAALLVANGCFSVHIGGGEPFWDFDGLVSVVKILTNARIAVEYIETNAFWVQDISDGEINKRLRALLNAGADTFCISRDAFHAEFVHESLPLKLAKVCRDAGFGYFMWSTDANSIRFGGRAVNIEERRVKPKPARDLTKTNPCAGLLSSNHFHVDLYGNFLPPGCTGIRIPLNEAVKGIDSDKYPIFAALLEDGSAGLLKYAEERGFTPNENGYTSACNLCFHTRRWLAENTKSPELDAEFYEESIRMYT